MQANSMNSNLKAAFIVGSSFCAGVCAYAGYRYWRKRQFKSIDEGFEDVSRLEENPLKRVLVLGLQGAGKTTILKLLIEPSMNNLAGITPTAGFFVTSMERHGITLNIWEVGGAENYKPYWANFFEGTDLLVFVVDSADLHAMSLAVREFHGMLLDRRLAKVSILLLAHKQDLPGALTPEEVSKALDVSHAQHPVTVLGTAAPPNATVRDPSMAELERTLLRHVLD